MKKILIVEDDKAIADNLCQIIELLGYEALPPAYTYDEAILHFNQFSPDLITLDIDLKSDKTGIDVARYIQGRCDSPFLFITAQTDECTMIMAADTKPCAHVPKPFAIADIKSAFCTAFKKELKENTIKPKP